jgi:hypothetical protein
MTVMMLMTAESRVMGNFVIEGWLRWLGWSSTLAMGACVIGMVVDWFVRTLDKSIAHESVLAFSTPGRSNFRAAALRHDEGRVDEALLSSAPLSRSSQDPRRTSSLHQV